jgi:ABC-type multidrug transport system ATPase subunit/phosphodiesterase/alkaline phosphatase D-like protein
MIKSGQISDSAAVVLKKLVKTYQKKSCGCCATAGGVFRAVKGTYLTIDEGNLLVLLGHNGAGKTTTIGMLTGLLSPTSGDALIFGNSIITDMDEIRKVMGVCPQYDILWPQMTGREHLELFAALKEVSKKQLESEVVERLGDVDLLKAQNIPSGSYSGGMKRRLSVAIALIGNPKIVFLDEPTTGMDPVSRRKVWNLIERVKRGRVTLLTTHSMEEADILGDKIAIMKDGYMAAVGTNLRLKNKFGTGYSVTVLSDPEKGPEVRQFVESVFNNRAADEAKARKESLIAGPAVEEEQFTLMSEMPGVLEYKIPSRYADTMSDFFEDIEARRKEFGIHDVQLSLTTLEDVFLRVAHQEEYKERPVKTYKKDFKTPFALLGVAMALMLATAIILSGVLIPIPIPITDNTAPARSLEPSPFVPVGAWSSSIYPSGVLVGDVNHDSAIISIQTSALSSIIVLAGDGESNTWNVVQTWNDTTPTPFFNVIQMTIGNLTEDTPYTVVAFSSSDTQSHSGATRFRTSLDPSRGAENNPRKITFGATCCLGRTNAPFESLNFAAQEQFDFFMLLGNSAYCDGAASPQQFQSRWNTTMTTDGFLNLARSTSFISTWDDQEVFEQWNYILYDPVIRQSLPPVVLAGIPQLVQLGALSYRNALPQRKGPNDSIYRSVQWGEVIEVFVLDVRTNRTNETMISQEQMEWLKQGLSESESVFKIIMTANAFTKLNSVLTKGTAPFRWDGYAAQQTELLDHVHNNNITGVLWIAGGLQFGMLAHLDKNNTVGWNYYEVGVGPSGSQINTVLRLNPFVSIDTDQYEFVFDTWTYTKFEADPITRNMTISFVDDSGTTIDAKTITL